MDERNPDPGRAAPPDPLERRLASWFEAEVADAGRAIRAAERGAGPRELRVRRAGLSLVGLGTFLAAALVLVLALPILRGVVTSPTAAPEGSPGAATAPGSAAPTVEPTPGPVTARYPDGLPSRLGDVPVLRAGEGIVRVQTSGSDTPVLVAGWYGWSGMSVSCDFFRIGPSTPYPAHVLFPDCERTAIPVYALADTPIGMNASGIWRITRFEDAAPPPDGPVVLRIHAHDARAATCPADVRESCEDAIVADAIPWTGDEATAAAPITDQDAVGRLQAVAEVIALPEDRSGTAASSRPSCAAFPTARWYRLVGDPRLALLVVFATTADREAAAAAGCIGGPKDPRVRGGYSPYATVAQDNVVLVGARASAARLKKALADPLQESDLMALPDPERTLPDARLAQVQAFVEARAAGAAAQAVEFAYPQALPPGDAHRAGRLLLDALRRRDAGDTGAYRIEEGDSAILTRAGVGPDVWTEITQPGVMATARVYVVTHDGVVDPELRTETFVSAWGIAGGWLTWVVDGADVPAWPSGG